MTFLWILEGIRTPFLDRLMQFITCFGEELVILAVICALYWCIDKRFAYILGLTYFTAGLSVQTLKITFRVPRPWILDPHFHAVGSAVEGATGYSFPSGHTQGAACLFFPAALKCRHIWGKFLCICAFVLVGFSRMYLGCHTLQDVLVSAALSVAISYAVWRFSSFFLDRTSYLKPVAAVLAVISISVAAYALILNANGVLEATYAKDCCKAAGAGLGFAIGFYIERRFLNFDTKEKNAGLQILKLVTGLALTLLLKEGISVLAGNSIYAETLEYFLLVLWVLVIYPYLFVRIRSAATPEFLS